MTLYFIIFGSLIGSRVGETGGFNYMAYIVPGLIMMSVITNSYANVSSSFFSEVWSLSGRDVGLPISNQTILFGYVTGGVSALSCGDYRDNFIVIFTHPVIHGCLITLLTAVSFRFLDLSTVSTLSDSMT